MIKLNSIKSVIYIGEKAVNKVLINDENKIDTFIASEITNYLQVREGNPILNPSFTQNAIAFNSDLDIVQMKYNNSIREISGAIIGVDTNYNANTIEGKVILICNFNSVLSSNVIVKKRSFGVYQTEMQVILSAGNNSQTFTTALKNFSFSIKYDGSKYVASAAGYSISSVNCKEQYSWLELAGSKTAFALSSVNMGLRNIQAKITTGIARY